MYNTGELRKRKNNKSMREIIFLKEEGGEARDTQLLQPHLPLLPPQLRAAEPPATGFKGLGVKATVSHAADPRFIPGIPYGPLSDSTSDSKSKPQLSTAKYGPKTEKERERERERKNEH